MVLLREHCCHLPSPSPGLRNPPRPLLVASPTSTGSSDSDGGLFAVPTTLPPNSRHGKLFFPNKETELTFRQHLSSISVSGPAPRPPPPAARPPKRGQGALSPALSPRRCSRTSSCQSPGSCGTGTCGSRWWSRSAPRPPARLLEGWPVPPARLLRTRLCPPGFQVYPVKWGSPCSFLLLINN